MSILAVDKLHDLKLPTLNWPTRAAPS